MSTDNATIIRDIWLNGTNDFQQRIPEPTQGNIQATIDAYREVGRRIAGLSPQTIVISSPHATMYRDYSVSEDLFHWQSQSTTSEGSKTGQRYIHHREMGTKILLFVREYKSDVGGAVPYTFLGPVDYVSHSGSCPMNILWRLETAIPAKFLSRTNQTAAG